MKRNLFYLPRTERIALCVAVLLLTAFGWWAKRPDEPNDDALLRPEEAAEVEAFLQDVAPATPAAETPAARPFPFDPNRADSLTLSRVGLRAPQIRNLLKYRARGGTFRSPDDVEHLYGLTREEFERLRPYIRIAPVKHRDKPAPQPAAPPAANKLTAGQRIDLAQADSATLCRIPGIGPYRAKAIVRYAERLGGFVSTSQLREIEGLPDDIEQWCCLTDTCVRKLSLNRASFKELLRHPYLTYEQVKAIVRHREKYGRLHDLRQLSLYSEFSPDDLARLSPYVVF